MTDHISPEDLDVAAALAAAESTESSSSDLVDEAALTSLLSDIQKLAKSSAPQGEDSLISLAKSAASSAASAAESLEKNEAQIARIEKSVSALIEAIQLLVSPDKNPKPLIVKSITHVEASPLDAQPSTPAVLTKSQVMDRAIAAMLATDDQSRLVELRSGIARLESNFHPATIAAELRLS